MDNNRIPVILSKAISVVLHPVLMPFYIVAVLMAGGMLLSHAVPKARLYFFAVVILNTVVVPAFCILLSRGLRNRNETYSRYRETLLPILVMIACYIACLYLIRNIPFTYPVHKMLIAGTGCLLAGFATTFFWRISLHMIAQGATVAFMALLVVSGADKLLAALCVSIALAAMLASARLYLGKSGAAQTAAGFITGFVITILSVYLF